MNIKEYLNGEEFENKSIEFKEIVSHKNYEKWLKEVAAFANTSGGIILFGIDDCEKVKGLTKEQIKIDIPYINDMCAKKLQPHIKFEFNKIKVSEKEFIIEMTVYKNDNLPVWLTRSDEQCVIYIRRDGQSVLAQGDQIEELILANKRLPYDKIITSIEYNSDDYSDLMSLFYEKNNGGSLSLKELQGIDAVTSDGHVTNGLLLFADNYYGHNCNVTCRLWPDVSKGDSVILDKKEFYGNIPQILHFSKNYILMNTKRGLEKLNQGGHVLIDAYPERALEEALINAIAHRDYYIDGAQIDIDIFTDRIQIVSPGSFLLPGNAQDYKLDSIPSRRRNEVICGILAKCKLMEKSGSGFDMIVRSYKNVSKEYQPKVYSDPAQFIITLYDLTYQNTGETSKKKNQRFIFTSPKKGQREFDYKILEFCLNEPKSRQEIQNYIELSNKNYFLNYILNPLLDYELLLSNQNSLRAPNQKYYTNKDKIQFN